MCVINDNYSGVLYPGLDYSTKEINQNFKIKVSGLNGDTKLHQLVGVSGLIDIVGDNEKVNNMLNRAFNKGLDKVECKLRRGLSITFYAI